MLKARFTFFPVKKSTKMLFSKMNKLQMQLENNNNNPTQEHSQAKSVQSSSFFLPDNDFKMFPGKDILEIKEIEKKLGSNSFFLKIVSSKFYLMVYTLFDLILI